MTTDVFFYYNVVAAIVLICVAVWATTYYWRKRTALQRQMDSQRLSLELFKADVARACAVGFLAVIPCTPLLMAAVVW